MAAHRARLAPPALSVEVARRTRVLRTKRNVHPITDVASHTGQYAPRALTSLASVMLVAVAEEHS